MESGHPGLKKPVTRSLIRISHLLGGAYGLELVVEPDLANDQARVL